HWVDPAGNLIARWGLGKTRRLFVAHMDELGYHVTGADPDGGLRVARRGGFYDWLYEGEIVRASGPDPPLGVVAPRPDYLVRPRPVAASPLDDRRRSPPPGYRPFVLADVRVDPGARDTATVGRWLGHDVTVVKEMARLGPHRFAARSLDDRYGCTALLLA